MTSARSADRARRPLCFPPAYASAWGDDRFGLWIEIEVASVVQRLRWIEPGEFVMGSPENEAERMDREGPQHKVRLTRGYWLADTACTQALWQAVMGSNPSHFADDPANPVENVNWDDTQAFLKSLQAQLPECIAELPTEAQWEYACRAGTQTPFSFGENITPEQVNYDGNYPYAGGKKGLYREKTLSVKALPANAWGLYQMHGNVWEWCLDDLRAYSAEIEIDPRGPEPEGERAGRVARGGSWRSDARRARSACRHRRQRGHRYHYQGFRFLLRSMVSQEQVAPEGLAGKTRRDAGSQGF